MMLQTLLAELQRRRVFRVAVVYAVSAWVVIQVASDVFPALNLPSWTVTLVVALSLVGFPAALVIGWAFDITPQGVERTESLVTEEGGVSVGSRRRRRPVRERAQAPERPPLPQKGPWGRFRRRGGDAEAAANPDPVNLPDPDRVRRAYLAALRHELQTPINAVIGYSEMILEETALSASDQSELRAIGSWGRELLSAVGEVLNPNQGSSAPEDAPSDEEVGKRLLQRLRPAVEAVTSSVNGLVARNREGGAEELLRDLQRIGEAAQQLLWLSGELVQGESVPAQAGSRSSKFESLSTMARQVLSKIRPVGTALGETAAPAGRLLVVDDNSINRDLLSRQLARRGYGVVVAKDGREALALVEAQDFDLVLLDIMMPDIDGYEALRRMKEDERLRDIPVVMISALDEVDSLVRCVQMGAEDYLCKPFDPVLLKVRIDANLELRELRRRDRLNEELLRAEREWSDDLLRSMVPPSLTEQIRSGVEWRPAFFPEVTALSAELDGAGRLAARGAPGELVARLSEIFGALDRLSMEHGVETTLITGYGYLAVAGLPSTRADHPEVMAQLALRMVEEVESIAEATGEPFRLRLALHTGSATAGLLSGARFTYNVWGDAVETAECLKRVAAPGTIQVSPATYARLRTHYRLEEGGVHELAGGGQLKSYLLQSAHPRQGIAVVQPHPVA